MKCVKISRYTVCIVVALFYGCFPSVEVIQGFIFFLVGVFIARGKEDALVTKNLVPGEAVYGEKRISIEVCDQVERSQLSASAVQIFF